MLSSQQLQSFLSSSAPPTTHPRQPSFAQHFRIATVEMHTGGEAVRIVTSGYPRLEGKTLLEKRRFAKEKMDAYRKLLMHEPRGHYDMYGAVLVEPDHPEAHIGVLFMHNEGYSTMCGHATIALGRYLVDKGVVPPVEPETEVRIQCPCGLVTAYVSVRDGHAGRVSFTSVPSFALHLNQRVSVAGFGDVLLDVSYGGAFYAILPAQRLGLSLSADRASALIEAADRVTRAVRASLPITHPTEPDLSFLYGTILTDGGDGADAPSTNICVFADREVDRSPTGSGVTARLALMHAQGLIANTSQRRRFRSIVGSEFIGSVHSETRVGSKAAVIARVEGKGHYSGEATFAIETDDPFPTGFLVK